MNPSDALFELIKSLTKSEKGYFKKFSSLHVIRGKNNYVKVFDAIAQQKQYDEKKIIALFHKEKFVKYFAVTKQYLYNLVLNSLKSYHSSIESELHGHLHGIVLLYEKRLYAQCEKLIAKAKQLAVKYDLQSPLIELLKWEVQLMGRQSFIGATEAQIRHVFNNIFSSIEQCKTNNNYLLHIYLSYLNEVKTGIVRNSLDMEALKKIMRTATLVLPPSANVQDKLGNELEDTSFHSWYLFYTAYRAYCSMQNDNENAEIYDQKLMRLFDVNPHQIIENPLQYAGTIHNCFVDNLYMKKYLECTDLIVKLKKIPVKSAIEKMNIDFLTDSMSVSLCLETGEFNKGIQLIQSMEGRWEKIDSIKISHGKILIFQYNTASLYFGIGNYHKANEYLNKIINETIDTGNDTQCFAWILSLLVHFELGNQDLLEYKVKSVHRFLYKRNRLYKMETIILDFISRELPKIYSDKALLQSFVVLLTKMKALTKDTLEQKAFDGFDFISWVESKIEKRPFAEVVREKAGKGL